MVESEQFKTASLLVKIGNAVTYYRNKKMEDLDLTSVQSDVLIDILRHPGITAREIKEHIQLSQSTVAGIITAGDPAGKNKQQMTTAAERRLLEKSCRRKNF